MTPLEQSFHKGMLDVNGEYSQTPIEITGKIPEWLSGNLIFNGPAKFHLAHQDITHWFLGVAMLKSFKISCKQVTYTNKFLHSNFYNEVVINEKRVSRNSGGSGFNPFHILSDIIFGSQEPGDNNMINVTKIKDKHVALTEAATYVTFDPDTLEVLGPLNFRDKAHGQATTAHPQMDFKRGELYNVLINYGRETYYSFYKIKHGTEVRVPEAKIPESNPAYLHSFAMSENYLILIEPPVRTSALKMRFSPALYFDKFKWDGSQGTKITIVSKDDGKIVKVVETDSFFMFHQISSYEVKGKLIIDLPTFKDSSFLQQVNMKKNPVDWFNSGLLTRITVDLMSGRASQERISDQPFEFPQLNYKKYNANEYRYLYGVGERQGMPLYSLVKFDMKNGDVKSWSEDHCFMGEALFIEKTDAKSEDDGVLLSIGLDANKDKSFVIIIDAKNMQELARAYAPHLIPYSFHGQFYRDGKGAAS